MPPRNEERDAQDQRDREAAAAAAAARGERGAAAAAGGRRAAATAAPPPTGPNQCHDITVYPEIGLAGGACAGLGLLLDIRDAAHPVRIDAAADANMSFWHSATFNNDGTKILFTDEWGGGGQPRCRATDKLEWGADALFTIENNKLKFHSYYKLPAPQTPLENCVAHNGSLIPIPGPRRHGAGVVSGRPVGVRLDRHRPSEGDRVLRSRSGRRDAHGRWAARGRRTGTTASSSARRSRAASTSTSWCRAASSRENELAAAKTVKMPYWNTQDQQKFVWPPSFALARAYLDQLARSNGLAAETIAAARTALAGAERESGAQRKTALTELASQLNAAAAAAGDQAKVRTLATTVTDLANAQR